MPGDIRNFFSKAGPSAAKEKKPTRKNVVASDSEEEEEKPAPVPVAKPASPAPKAAAVNPDAFFGDAKITKKAPIKVSKPAVKKAAAPVKDEFDFDDDDDDMNIDFDMIDAEVEATQQRQNDSQSQANATAAVPGSSQNALDISSDDDTKSTKRKAPSTRSTPAKRVKTEEPKKEEAIVIDDTEEPTKSTPVKGKAKASKAKSYAEHMQDILDLNEAKEDEDDDYEPSPKKAKTPVKASPTKKSPAQSNSASKAKPKKAAEPQISAEAKAILDAIPSADVPDAVEPVPFKFGGQQQQSRGATAPGSKEVPEGAPDCLIGLNFVLTGILPSLDREVAGDLIKRYGGKITATVSGKTSFVVLGESAGPSKIRKIHELKLRTIDEDGLLQMIRTMPGAGGSGLAAQKVIEKREQEAKKVQTEAIALEKQEKAARLQNEAKLKQKQVEGVVGGPRVFDPVDQLWTTKYAPKAMKDIMGNKAGVEKLERWLKGFPAALAAKFKKGGPDGLGLYRAVLISGVPGIGKTTSAHLVAQLAGYDVLEFNASDTRSKKLLEQGLAGVVDNTSLNGFFAADGQQVQTKKKNMVLIMDEVDGMSSGDRGGVGALNAVIRKTTIPIICICNDRSSIKLKPLMQTTIDLRFQRATKDQIRSRILTIAFREKLKISREAVDQLVEGTGSDIRQIINLLSMHRLTMTDMDSGRETAKASEKNTILKPWDIVGQFLNGATFSERSTLSLNDKIELYFNDHSLSYLMVQENYLQTHPARCNGIVPPKRKTMKHLQLIEKAASGISDSDLVDQLIHGAQQHWSLMPVHAVFSCVRPCSFVAGVGNGRYGFPAVLGRMSTTGKAYRQLREVQAHLRLKVSGDRFDIRRDYLPMLHSRLGLKLQEQGQAAIPGMIALMDDYYLNKDDYDSLLELGLSEEIKIETAVKSAFTRQYNAAAHPVAFLPTALSGAASQAKKLSKEAVPDIEDALELSDDEAAAPADKPEVDEDDISKDKAIKALKAKGKGAAAAKGKGKKAATGANAAGSSSASKAKGRKK